MYIYMHGDPQPPPTLHQRMRSWLTEHAAALPPGSLLPREIDVAERFKASRQTAHKVMAELQRDGLVRRVKGRGSFTIAQDGAVLDAKRSRRVGGTVVIAYPNWFSYDIWAKVDRATLAARELRLQPVEYRVTSGLSLKELKRMVAGLDDVRGVVLIPPGAQLPPSELELLDSIGVPVVVLVPVAGVENTKRVCSISKDCAQAGRLIIDELAKAGHRRIGYIANEPWSLSTDLTYAGIKQGLYDNGLRLKDLRRSDQSVEAWDDSMESGLELTKAMLAEDRPTALIVDSVPGVLGVYSAIRSLGLSIPDDISVIVNDDYSGLEAYLWPPLTTIAVNRATLVRRALELMLGDAFPAGRSLVEGVSVVRRDSVASPIGVAVD